MPEFSGGYENGVLTIKRGIFGKYLSPLRHRGHRELILFITQHSEFIIQFLCSRTGVSAPQTQRSQKISNYYYRKGAKHAKKTDARIIAPQSCRSCRYRQDDRAQRPQRKQIQAMFHSRGAKHTKETNARISSQLRHGGRGEFVLLLSFPRKRKSRICRFFKKKFPQRPSACHQLTNQYLPIHDTRRENCRGGASGLRSRIYFGGVGCPTLAISISLLAKRVPQGGIGPRLTWLPCPF